MRYQDYVIKDGEFIGRFDEMYAAVDDPWHCQREVDSWKNALLLAALRQLRLESGRGFDIGCGLGGLTRRMQAEVPTLEWTGLDVSETAIEKCRRDPGPVEFRVHDLLNATLPCPDASVDLVTMAEVMWYILPRLQTVLGDIHRVLKPGGRLVILQYFLSPQEQGYGKEWIADPQDLLGLLTGVGFRLENTAYTERQPPLDLLVVARRD